MFALLTLAPAPRLPHEYDLVHVKFNVKLDYKTESISGVVLNQVNTTKANANLVFDKGPMTIKKVTLDPKLPADISTKGNHVQVKLKKAPVGKTVKVSIEYSASPEAGLYFVPQSRAFPALTDVSYTQGEMEDTRYWLPTYDFPDDKATTEGIITVPKGFSVLSNGALKSATTKGDFTTFHWQQNKPMSTYLISVVTGRYTKIPDGKFKDIPVEIWAPAGTEGMAKAAFEGTDRIVALFSKLTGVDYPWAKYAQSFVPEFMFGGMENTSCTTQTINSLFPANSIETESADGLNAHELAHQWFGDLITCKDWSHIWVNEGWATLMPHFWTREQKGDDAYHLDRKSTYDGARWGAEQHPMVRNDYTIPMEMFDANAYPGGATRMFMLLHELGEEQFWKSCKRYLELMSYQNVTTEKFFDSWSKTSGKDLDSFRKTWFYTKGVPSYRVERNGKSVTVSQTNRSFKVPVEYIIADEEIVRRRGRITEQTEAFELEPGQVLVLDPGAWLLCDLSYPNYKTDDWKIAFKHADNAAQKARLLPALRSDQDFLIQEFARSSAPMQQHLVGYISNLPFLREQLSNGRDALKNSVLYRFRDTNAKSADDVKLIREVFDSTKSESTKNAAFDVLLALVNTEEIAELGWNTTTYDLQTQVSALNWYASKQPDKGREMALKAVKEFAPGPVRIAAISALGRVRDKEGSREVFNLLVQLAKGRPYAPFSAAVEALASYGDKAAIPVLESRRNHNLHFARNVIESALSRLNP
jgi:aminopeptidase N